MVRDLFLLEDGPGVCKEMMILDYAFLTLMCVRAPTLKTQYIYLLLLRKAKKLQFDRDQTKFFYDLAMGLRDHIEG